MESLRDPQLGPPIECSPEEDALLRFVARFVDDEAAWTDPPRPSAVYVVGGWVRDKLLRRASDDLDLAVAGMLGRDFADCLRAFLARAVARGDPEACRAQNTHAHARTNSNPISNANRSTHFGANSSSHLNGDASGMAPATPTGEARMVVIGARPDASKLIEVAKVRLFGQYVDVVHLRAPVRGADDAEQRLGSAADDVRGRDFTVNALFYNVRSRTVEDFTGGRGLRDLGRRALATVAPPAETFMCDPVRLFRAARFASVLDFAVDSDVLDALAAAPELRVAAYRCSRERFGTELDKILRSPQPVRGYWLLRRLGVEGILHHPSADLDSAEDPLTSDRRLRVLQAVCAALDGSAAGALCVGPALAAALHLSSASADPDVARALRSAAVFLPAALELLRAAPAPTGRARDASGGGLGRTLQPLRQRMFDYARRSNHDSDVLERLAGGVSEFLALMAAQTDPDAAAVGGFVRRMGVHWPVAVLAAVAVAAEPAAMDASRSEGSALPDAIARGWAEALASGVAPAARLSNYAAQRGLDRAYDMRPMMAVADVIERLQVPPGPRRGALLTCILEWQFRHPDGDSAALLAHIVQSLDSDESSSSVPKKNKR